ncbi:MAG: hypothetical protein JSS98_16400 [Bacteroidetes bacterium]|nr:hypothetical protein [Bacteroidota bacterium]
MDFYQLIFILLSILITGVIATWIILRNRKAIAEKKLKETFYQFSKQHDLFINKSQTLNGNMIGIDRRKLKILFLNCNNGAAEVNVIDIKNVGECTVQHEINTANGFIKNINLRCTMRNTDEMQLLPFYHEKPDTLNKKMRLSKKASYWAKAINLYRAQN